MVQICAIASGSNGNCYYVGNQTSAILVDVGIYTKRVLERMERVKLDIQKVKAIFISHEHADHMRGVKVLSKKHSIPVYMTSTTYHNSWHPNRPQHFKVFNPNEPITIDDITVHPFIKNHDAAEPCSFRVEVNGKNIGVMTDIGAPCINLESHFKQCDAAFLESNYDEEMLDNGKYPYPLKERVKSDLGHLSNRQAVEFASQHIPEQMELLLLSHLSGDNNTPQKALLAFSKLTQKAKIELTFRHKPTKVFTLGHHNERQLNLDFNSID